MPDLPSPTPAFDRRVQEAVAMLLNGDTPQDVRELHGRIVLERAQYELSRSAVQPVERWGR